MSERITFTSGGVRCVGQFFDGSGGDDAFAGPDGRRPCIVLGHGFGGTVDSGLVPFAERFAQAGLHALAFDYRHFGESDGEPRQLLDAQRQHADFAAAVTYARERDGVDPERIVVWGSSYAGGHVVEVAAADPRMAGAIAQAPAMDGAIAVVNIVGYAGPGALLRLTAAGIKDVLASARRAEPVRVPVVGPPGAVAAMTSADAEPGYRAITGPTWRNEVCARIFLRAGLYRPGLKADRLPCPILIQIADKDTVAPTKAAEAAAWLATGRAEVRTYPIGHFEIYDGAPFERAVGDQLHFLRRHLTGAAAKRAPEEAVAS